MTLPNNKNRRNKKKKIHRKKGTRIGEPLTEKSENTIVLESIQRSVVSQAPVLLKSGTAASSSKKIATTEMSSPAATLTNTSSSDNDSANTKDSAEGEAKSRRVESSGKGWKKSGSENSKEAVSSLGDHDYGKDSNDRRRLNEFFLVKREFFMGNVQHPDLDFFEFTIHVSHSKKCIHIYF